MKWLTLFLLGGTLAFATIERGNLDVKGNMTLSGSTATTVPYLDSAKKFVSSAVTPTELGYVSGVTSAIQTQLNAKLSGTNAPTQQIFISGSGVTYTRPTAPTPLYIRIRMVGGGGGGCGTNATNVAGGNGGTSTWSGGSLSAGAGIGGPASGASGGTGGAASGGNVNNIAGQIGAIAATTALEGATGGASGGGMGLGGVGQTGAGSAATGNGGGGGSGMYFNANCGAGGGAGYVEHVIASPASTYTYTVGAAGAAGASTNWQGGAGTVGKIIVDEYYQ